MSNHIRVTPETHRLTNLPGPRHPLRCQRCAGVFDRAKLGLWQEADHRDQFEADKFLLLCKPCSEAVIEQHPRLYRPVGIWTPFPGLMTICATCAFRSDIYRKCIQAKLNGGTGVNIKIPSPSRGFVDGKHYSGPFVHWSEPATDCDRREEAPSPDPSIAA